MTKLKPVEWHELPRQTRLAHVMFPNLSDAETQRDLAQLMNWPPFRPDSRHNLEGLRLCSSTGLCLTIINELN